MDDVTNQIREMVQDKRRSILALLEEMVGINSYSRNYEGINLVVEIVRRSMPTGLSHRAKMDRNGVNHHLFSTQADRKIRNLVLLGHGHRFSPGRGIEEI